MNGIVAAVYTLYSQQRVNNFDPELPGDRNDET